MEHFRAEMSTIVKDISWLRKFLIKKKKKKKEQPPTHNPTGDNYKPIIKDVIAGISAATEITEVFFILETQKNDIL